MNKIQEYMASVFQSYKEVFISSNCKEFWDVIVVTTHDEGQKDCLKKQLEELFKDTPLIKGRLYVVADPPNQKLGCGGSTLQVLKTLDEIFGSKLYGKKILIIHSGGSSQRLPSYSVQGKIFSPIPIQDFLPCSRVYHMIDLKLALYLPFCRVLRAGIFVTCSDDIETYYLEPGALTVDSLRSADVVALAHPCALAPATGHGVYVLPDLSRRAGDAVVVSPCREVLQKPSVDVMREKGAIVAKDQTGEEMVYSDSVFWMSENAYRPLLSWYLNTSLTSELDAYSHFLPCLGTNMKNCNLESFTGYKRQLLPILRNLEFKVIVLNQSKFYHLGTMKEYLENFTGCESFRKELNIVTGTSNGSCSVKDGKQREKCFIVASCVSDQQHIQMAETSSVIVEWCTIDIPIYVCQNLILSNCVVKKCEGIEFLSKTLSFFGSFLYHTIPVRECSRLTYVTVAFEIHSNLKRQSHDIIAIDIASVPLQTVMQESCLRERDVVANGKPFSLWSLKLFRGGDTAEESFWKTHNFVNLIFRWRDGEPMQTNAPFLPSETLYSMKEVAAKREFSVFLEDRKTLLKQIGPTK